MIIKKSIIYIITLYKKIISPFLPRTCRFYPTCSQYMIQAIEKYGLMKGMLKGCGRIIRCHPFNPGGYDPVK